MPKGRGTALHEIYASGGDDLGNAMHKAPRGFKARPKPPKMAKKSKSKPATAAVSRTPGVSPSNGRADGG